MTTTNSSFTKESLKGVPSNIIDDFLIREKHLSDVYRKYGCPDKADECDRIYAEVKAAIA